MNNIKQYFIRPVFSVIQVFILSVVVVFVLCQQARNRINEIFRGSTIPVVELGRESDSPVPEYKYKKNYSFTDDWFSMHVPIWSKALAPFAGKPNIRYLEIGVFEGRAAMWMLEEILTGPGAGMTGLDLFEGTYDIKYPAFGDRYFANVAASGASEKVTSIKGYSQIELRKLPLDSYDIIYIDGSHENHAALEDAVLAWRLLKSGGILIFDDYGRRQPEFSAPKLGIDTFFRFFGDHFVVLHNDHQVFLKKK